MEKVNFEAITLRVEATHRGGGIEIDLSSLGWPQVKMTAYQNYLGGGMLGRVCNDCTLKGWEDNDYLEAIAEQLREYFHSLTNPESEWESTSYDQNQRMPVSGY